MANKKERSVHAAEASKIPDAVPRKRGMWQSLSITNYQFSITNFQFITSLLLFITLNTFAQSNRPPQNPAQTNLITPEFVEKLRADCVNGRRSICGRILKILPEGLIVESGYTNLLRKPLTDSWLVPGTAEAIRATNLVEAVEPGTICVGTVFLSDLPKSRRAKPKPYDYVIIEAFPAGEYTYTSVGNIRKTVRHFSANLSSAMKINLKAAYDANPPPAKQ